MQLTDLKTRKECDHAARKGAEANQRTIEERIVRVTTLVDAGKFK